MLNRKIFISLTIVVNILIITFVCVNPLGNVLTIGNFIGGIILANLMMLLIGMLICLISGLGTDNILNTLITPIHGYILFKMKGIYYSDLGYFWVLKIKDSVFVFQQKPLYLKKVAEVDYYNIERLKSDIEIEIRFKFSSELKENKRKNEYKNWDGYIDKKSARDAKLRDIGIKGNK